MFWLMPLLGAGLAGVVYPLLCEEQPKAEPIPEVRRAATTS
jgi:hypothetical protein